jgi:hypothetical protein
MEDSLLAQSAWVNFEAGINILTLQSLTRIMEHIHNNYQAQDEFIPDAQEAAFLAQLPPSFPVHSHSLLDVVGKDFMTKFASCPLLGVRYTLHQWRRIVLPDIRPIRDGREHDACVLYIKRNSAHSEHF